MDKEAIDRLAQQLSRLPENYLPTPVFNAVARVVVLTAIEFIPLINEGGLIKVWLSARKANDEFWPNKLHTPGTILRPSDSTFQDAFQRLFDDELGIPPVDISYFATDIMKHVRGRTVAMQYVVPLTDSPEGGHLYDVDTLPETIVKEQIPMIEAAVSHFKRMNA